MDMIRWNLQIDITSFLWPSTWPRLFPLKTSDLIISDDKVATIISASLSVLFSQDGFPTIPLKIDDGYLAAIPQ